MKIFTVFFLLLINLGLAQNNQLLSQPIPKIQTKNQDHSAEEDDIREAIFRYQFQHNASGQQQGARVYFLSLGGDKDPSDDFMKRFKGNKPSVKKVSQSTFNEVVKDKETGENGLIFRVTEIKWINDNEVEASGGYYEAGLSSSGNTYTVKREKGKWTVTKDEMNWIS